MLTSGKITDATAIICFLAMMFLLSCLTTGSAYADNWADLSGAETLREFVAGASAEIKLRQGVVATGEYYEDGTAKIKDWGEFSAL